MTQNIPLNDFKVEQEIENNFDSLTNITDMEQEIALFKQAAFKQVKKNKSITLRINEMDLESLKLKASKCGVPYQTYITMLIHKDSISPL